MKNSKQKYWIFYTSLLCIKADLYNNYLNIIIERKPIEITSDYIQNNSTFYYYYSICINNVDYKLSYFLIILIFFIFSYSYIENIWIK